MEGLPVLVTWLHYRKDGSTMSSFSRFDLILIADVVLAVAFVAQESWLRVNGYGDLSSGCWTFLTAVFGGEILTFSLYQIVKQVSRKRQEKDETPKAITGKHAILKDLEEAQDEGKTAKPQVLGDHGSVSR